jgi:hypothetical protein
MTIEIQRPELEALIHERMKSGAFQSIEDVLMEALKASSAKGEKGAQGSDDQSSAMGAELVEAMQASPLKEIGLEPDASICLCVILGSDGVVAGYQYPLGTAAAQA